MIQHRIFNWILSLKGALVLLLKWTWSQLVDELYSLWRLKWHIVLMRIISSGWSFLAASLISLLNMNEVFEEENSGKKTIFPAAAMIFHPFLIIIYETELHYIQCKRTLNVFRSENIKREFNIALISAGMKIVPDMDYFYSISVAYIGSCSLSACASIYQLSLITWKVSFRANTTRFVWNLSLCNKRCEYQAKVGHQAVKASV